MSIINNIEQYNDLDDKSLNQRDRLTRQYSNYVNTFIGENIDDVVRVDLDIFENLFSSLTDGICRYYNANELVNHATTTKDNANESIKTLCAKLNAINAKESVKTTLFGSRDDISRGSLDYINELAESKKEVVSSIKSLISDVEMCEKSLITNGEKRNDAINNLNVSYELLTLMYPNFNLDLLSNNFSKESLDELQAKFEPILGEYAKTFVNKVYDMILYEINYYMEVTSSLKVFSFNDIDKERLNKIIELNDKYKAIRRVLDLKEDIMMNFFIDMSLERENPRKHKFVVNTYKTLLDYTEDYLDGLDRGNNRMTTEASGKIMDHIDNVTTTVETARLGKRLNRLYGSNVII